MPTTTVPTNAEAYAMLADRFPTYADALAAHRAGEIGHLDLVRCQRIHGVHLMARHITRAISAGETAAYVRRQNERAALQYTDEALDATLAAGEAAAPGPYREAALLRTLATVDARQAVVLEAHRFCNATPSAGRWSDAVRSCMDVGRRIDAEVAR